MKDVLFEVAYTEASVRKARDIVFGKPSTDRNWRNCRENWMRPDSAQWLMERAYPGIFKP